MKLYTICQSAWRYLTIAVSDEFDPNTLDAHQLLEDEEIWFDEDDPTIEESQSVSSSGGGREGRIMIELEYETVVAELARRGHAALVTGSKWLKF